MAQQRKGFKKQNKIFKSINMQFYKKWGLAIATLILASGITWALKAQQKIEDKKYKVEMTVQEWSIKLQYLDYVKQQLRVSDLPSKQVAFISDSLISPFQTQIMQQIQFQLASEQRRDTISQHH